MAPEESRRKNTPSLHSFFFHCARSLLSPAMSLPTSSGGGGPPGGSARLARARLYIPIADEEMVDALKAVGANVQFTIYPEADHDSWTRTYDDPKFYEWLLEQRRCH